jgi:hypothetical protein
MYSANLGRPGDVQSFTHGDHFECLIRKYRQWGVQARMVRTHFVVPDRFHHQSSFSAPRNDRVYSHYDDPPTCRPKSECVTSVLHCDETAAAHERPALQHPGTAGGWSNMA